MYKKILADNINKNICPLDLVYLEECNLENYSFDNSSQQLLYLETMRAKQWLTLQQSCAYAFNNSIFYKKKWQHLFDKSINNSNNSILLQTIKDFESLPFIDSSVLQTKWQQLLCVKLDDIARIITLQSSGTTGSPKKIAFTEQDLESTKDFFAIGMSQLAKAQETVLILLPGAERPNGVSSLLIQALEKINIQGQACNPKPEKSDFIELLKRYKPSALVAAAYQYEYLLKLNIHSEFTASIKKVLISAENISQTLKIELQKQWACEVFEHYGLTESGYGAAVECYAHEGQHYRFSDLYFELIHPITQEKVLNNQAGELVLTTLNRQAMPLIRYKTGDYACLDYTACACGSPLPRLKKIYGRIEKNNNSFSIIQAKKGAYYANNAQYSL